MEILIGMSAAVVILAAFFLGFITGKETAAKQPAPVSLDDETRHWNEEQQRAFLECMSYSQEVAYGSK